MVIQHLIQSQLFHLISMLICIGVVVCLFVRHFFRGESEMSQNNRIRLLNTLYISGILTFIIIELVTAICMGNTRHSDILSFVSFAATLSSLILSVVAIIFTIVSGKRGESQYQKIDKVSDEVKVSLSRFSDKTESIDKSIERFQEVADNLSGQLHDIYEKISGIEKPIIEIREQMLTDDTVVNDNKQKNGDIDDSFKNKVVSFISNGSYSGNLALYACVLSSEKKRPFLMSQIREGEDDEAYKFGYIIASSAINVISAKVSKPRRIEVIYCYPNLKEMLENAIKDYINESTSDVAKKIATEQFDNITKVFE